MAMTTAEKLSIRILLLVAYAFAPSGIAWSIREIAKEIKDGEPDQVDLQASGCDGDVPPAPAGSLSYNRAVLNNIRSLLDGKALDGVAMYKIGGRELTNIPLPELRDWEAQLEARVSAQIRRKNGYRRQAAPITFGGC